MRKEPADQSEMINQLLFGECFEIMEKQKKWSLVRLQHDGYEGWIDNKQYRQCSPEYFDEVKASSPVVVQDMIEIVSEEMTAEFFPVFMGSYLPLFRDGEFRLDKRVYSFNGSVGKEVMGRRELVGFAYQYLHAPYLWGGRSPFGLDCSGFTQIVYRLCGYQLPRDAYQQATHGITLSFLEESEPGDLAFFDNEEGKITHVGIILQDNFIIHASGKVRLDRLDQMGIFNRETSSHTHKLRVIKKII